MELTDEQWEQARRIARAKAGDLVRGDAARQEDLAQEALERLLRMEDRAFDDLDAFVRQIVTNLVMNSVIHGFEGVERGRIRIDDHPRSVRCGRQDRRGDALSTRSRRERLHELHWWSKSYGSPTHRMQNAECRTEK